MQAAASRRLRAEGLRQFRPCRPAARPASGSRSSPTCSPSLRPNLRSGLAIGLARNIRDGDALVRSGQFDGWRPDPVRHRARSVRGRHCRHGPGRPRRGTASVTASAAGCSVSTRRRNARRASCRSGSNQALEIADFVILCAPLTPGSHHQIGAQALARMKPEALLINVGRGSVVDESAVLAALETRPLAGYAADVFEMEDWALPDRPNDIDRTAAHASAHAVHAASRLGGHAGTAAPSRCARSTISPMCWKAAARAMRSTSRAAPCFRSRASGADLTFATHLAATRKANVKSKLH